MSNENDSLSRVGRERPRVRARAQRAVITLLSIAVLLLSGCVTSDCVTSDCRCAAHFDAGQDAGADGGSSP